MSKKSRRYFLLLLLFFWSATLPGRARETPLGKWTTIDDDTGKPKSIVEIFEQDGELFGRILQIFPDPGDDSDPICDQCTDHRKNQKVIGMTILNRMKKDGKEWSGGEIMDPENGKTYRCRMWLEEGTLKVRGYIAFLFRTQTWHPTP